MKLYIAIHSRSIRSPSLMLADCSASLAYSLYSVSSCPPPGPLQAPSRRPPDPLLTPSCDGIQSDSSKNSFLATSVVLGRRPSPYPSQSGHDNHPSSWYVICGLEGMASGRSPDALQTCHSL
eukprot:60983-Prorocentrum_minimum.AAC.4